MQFHSGTVIRMYRHGQSYYIRILYWGIGIDPVFVNAYSYVNHAISVAVLTLIPYTPPPPIPEVWSTPPPLGWYRGVKHLLASILKTVDTVEIS